MPYGDYGHYQRFHTSRNTTNNLVVGTAGPVTLIAARTANHTVFIQKITVSINVFSAKTMTFQDTAGTPVLFGLISVPAAATALPSESGTIVFDFGPEGAPVTLGKDLNLALSGAGVGATIHVEAYEKLGAVVAIGPTN